MTRLPLNCLLALALIGGGFLTGRIFDGSESVEQTREPEPQPVAPTTITAPANRGIVADTIPSDLISILDAMVQLPTAWDQLNAAVKEAEGWDVGTLDSALEYLYSNYKYAQSQVIVGVLMSRYRELNFDDWMQFVVRAKEATEEGFAEVYYSQIREWAAEDSDAVWTFAGQFAGDADILQFLKNSALVAMANVDPLKAYRLYQSVQGTLKGDALEHIVRRIAESDLARALTMLEEAPSKETNLIIAGLVGYFSEHDLEGGLKFFSELKDQSRFIHPYGYQLIQGWVRKNPDMVIERVLALPESESRGHLLNAVISTWSLRDMDAAINWVLPRISDPTISQSWNALVYRLVYDNPTKGLAIIDAHPELKDSRRNLISSWFQVDPLAAIEWVEKNVESREFSEVVGENAYSVYQTHPQIAMRLIDLMPMGRDRDNALRTVAGQLAKADVEGALNWVLNQPEDLAQRLALSGVVKEWTLQNSAQASEMIFKLDIQNELTLQQMVRTVAGAWAESEPQASLDWLNRLDDERLKHAAMSNLVSEWSKTDMAGATEYVLKITDAKARDDLLSPLIRTTAYTNISQALALVESLTAEQRTDKITRDFISTWTQRDSVGASAWINELPDGHERDVAAGSLVGQLSRQSPNDALPWALSIKDASIRDRALIRLASGARNLDREVVEKAIEATSYDDSKKANYRKNYLSE